MAQKKDVDKSFSGRFEKLDDSRMGEYQKLRRDHLIKSYGDILKDDKLNLENSGGLSIDIAEDKTHFRVLLSIIYNEGERKSYPLNITRELFNIPENIDVTKTSEYNKIIRYIKRWEKARIIQKSKTKLQHNISYYLVNYNGITKQIITHIKNLSRGWLEENFKKLKYKDNEYIIAFVKLYYYFLSVESPHYRNFTFNSSIFNLIRYLFETIDKDMRQLADLDIDYEDIDDLTYIKGIEKYGIKFEREEGRIVGTSLSDDFDIKKIPKKMIQEMKEKKIDAFANTMKYDPVFNLQLGEEKYRKKDKKLSDFFHFVLLLRIFYDHYDSPKAHSNLVIPELLNFIRIKYDKKRHYEDESSITKSWLEGVKDLEKKIDEIHKFRFHY